MRLQLQPLLSIYRPRRAPRASLKAYATETLTASCTLVYIPPEPEPEYVTQATLDTASETITCAAQYLPAITQRDLTETATETLQCTSSYNPSVTKSLSQDSAAEALICACSMPYIVVKRTAQTEHASETLSATCNYAPA